MSVARGGGGGVGLSPCRDLGGGGGQGGREGTGASADVRPGPANLGQGARKATCTLRRCRHTRTSSRAPSHTRAVASFPARGYWCCWGSGGDPGAGNTAYHTAYTLGIEASTAPAAAYWSGGHGEVLVAPGEALDIAVVGDTHPMAPGFLRLAAPPLDQGRPALRGAGPCLWVGGPAAADGEVTRVPEGRQQRGHPSALRAHDPVEAGGPPERDCCAIPPAEGPVERGPGYREALGDALWRRQPAPEVRPRSRLVAEAPHEDVL